MPIGTASRVVREVTEDDAAAYSPSLACAASAMGSSNDAMTSQCWTDRHLLTVASACATRAAPKGRATAVWVYVWTVPPADGRAGAQRASAKLGTTSTQCTGVEKIRYAVTVES